MAAIMPTLRLCFIVLFGTMSLMHGPVMTFSGAHAATHAGHPAADHHDPHAIPDCHDDQPQPPASHFQCNAFACFTAVEPLPGIARPVLPILFAILEAAPASVPDPLQTPPALPPPRLRS